MKLWLAVGLAAVDNAVMTVITERTSAETHGLKFACKSGMLFYTLPSARKLACMKPRIGIAGGESVTYEGIGAAKKLERIESYGPQACGEHRPGNLKGHSLLCHADLTALQHCDAHT